MPARADLGWSPRGPGWDKLLVVAMLLAAAGCSGAPHSVSSPPSTQVQLPYGVSWRNGWKKNGIDIEACTASQEKDK